MRTVSVRELRNEIPRLRETLESERELLLVSNGVPIARILPVEAEPPKLKSLAWLRAKAPYQEIDSTTLIREARDRRGT
jgi:antitoxin (DNA-binding transcriptional repressor) of toxin-antitoxin stability system